MHQGTTYVLAAKRPATRASCARPPTNSDARTGVVVPEASRLELTTHANGSMRARRRSSWSAAASETGVVSGKVTRMTRVYCESCRRISGVTTRATAARSKWRTIWR